VKKVIQRSSFCLLSIFSLGLQPVYAGDLIKNGGNVVALSLPIFAAGTSLANDDTSGFWQLTRSESATILLTEVLKFTTHEKRPNGRNDLSFPSGHTSIAFSAAQYLQMREGWKYGVPAYIAASFVGYSRVHAKEHYTRDVLAGAALGIGTSYWLTDQKNTRIGVAMTPRGGV